MQRIGMTVFKPERRQSSGFVAKWRDPVTGRRRQKTLHAMTQREAYAAATTMADQIVSGCNPDDMPWQAFADLYESLALGKRSKSSRQSWRKTSAYVIEHNPLATIQDVSSAWVTQWQAKLAKHLKAQNTLATYSARLRAALRWAERQRIIDRAPFVAVEWEQVPSSRAITGEEFDRILAAVPYVRPHDSLHWNRLLRGLTVDQLAHQ